MLISSINVLLPAVLIVALLSAVAILWRSLNRSARKNNQLERDIAVEQERSANFQMQIAELKETLEKCKTRVTELQQETHKHEAQASALKIQRDQERHSAEEKIALLQQAEKKMTDAFENLSNRILEENSSKFIVQNKQNLNGILDPLREQLSNFHRKVEDVYDKESKDRQSLHHEIIHLKSLNEKMSRDAINLTEALKGDSKKRGQWGEVILERVLEESGLQKGREYEVQTSYRDEEKARYVPDVVVHLPNQRDVIIDSKISLNAYERYYSANDEREKQIALKEHLASIRAHINDLKKKPYDKLIGINSLDMILMFVAIEPALMLALDQDKMLFQKTFESGIFLVSPSTLSMSLQLIHNMWRYEYQNQNAREIAKRAGDMYDKFVGFTDALKDIGDKLDKAQGAYQTAHNRLAEGRGNLISRAEKIRELGGLKTDKQLGKQLTNAAGELKADK